MITPGNTQTQLQLPYDRARWLALLKALLPGTEVLSSAQALPVGDLKARSAAQIARIPLADGRMVAVLEVEVTGRVDVQHNRVGLRNLVAKFIDQHNAHAVLGFFFGEGSRDGDYRLSLVAKSSEISADGQLSRTETDKRRYTYILGRGQPCRTPAERLDLLRKRNGAVTLEHLVEAFKVEPLFKEFFRDYGRVFAEVESLTRATLPDKESLRLFTQRLFNRLMFLAFVERKGWLKLAGRTDYLAALWDTYAGNRTAGGSFYRNRLVPLFFEGLNQPGRPPDHTDPRFGSVPYLNGGLFEKADDGTDARPEIVVPDKAIELILTELFARYNFTVSESTPMDIEVAVDPEMLGKVFEELVTGRHEQGSYYTPKPIVSFMCREALVGHLASRCEKESRAALEAFVHDHKADDLRDAETVLAALRAVTVCDPACGSGAYLLGMLHELLDLRTCLFTDRKLDAATAHGRKLEIIEQNLYGVDKDAFAVNIARLRLWLSLAVEYDGTQPPPALPNLDFKIEQGDSLAAPSPAAVDADLFRTEVMALRDMKTTFLNAHGAERANLRTEIAQRKQVLKASFLSQKERGPSDAFQWAIEFAEVFVPPQRGFDIVVANPPYVRMELIKPQKPVLRKRFPLVHAERADLYVYFFARAHELLRDGGTAAFISSNKWLRAGYGEALRQHLLDAQAFGVVMDYGELPVFEAATDTAIFIWNKHPRDAAETRWAMVKDLDRCFAEGVRAHFLRLASPVPATQFGKGKPRLATAATADLRARMERSGPRLGELCKGLLGWGIKTGLNEAFIIPQTKRNELIADTPAAAEIIKPLLTGDDVRRYELYNRGTWLIYTCRDLDIRRYPSIEKHLRPFRSFKDERGKPIGLDHRATVQEWFELQQPQMAYSDFFAAPKIVYPDFGKELRFAMDMAGHYGLNTSYFIARQDWYLLAVLNSSACFQYLKGTCQLLGDEDDGGRLRFFGQYLETLPIPDASASDRATVAALAERTQGLHGQRRARVERFLRDLGLDPAQSTSRNPLEQPWTLSPLEFTKRTKPLQRAARERPQVLYESARDETATLTEQIAKIEAEIDARVAALYGLDAEDQRWAAKASPAAQSDDKSALFFHILGGLKEKAPYFPLSAIQTAVNDAELKLEDSTLRGYLVEAVTRGLLHDAGRGWYSGVAEPFAIHAKPVAKLVKTLETAFPLLDFTCWSTEQIASYGHHLLAKFVSFVHTERDAMESVGEQLRGLGWDVSVNPRGVAAKNFTIRSDRTVVVRPRTTNQPSAGRLVTIEGLLVELFIEARDLGLMDAGEYQRLIESLASRHRIRMAALLDYARERRPIGLDLAQHINAEFLKIPH